MSHIPNLRKTTVTTNDVQAVPQGYLDTPNLIYSDWMIDAGGINESVGTVPEGTNVGVIGGGAAGMSAAFELQKCGANVTVFEAENRLGGRCYSIPQGSTDIAEMGSMRFPPSEDSLYYYASQLGFHFEDNFPDPGHYDTFISYKGSGAVWKAGTPVPAAFKTVHDGWIAFISNGVKQGHNTIFASAASIQTLLQNVRGNPGNVATITQEFQKYLNEFGEDSFYTGLKKIFGASHKWDVPGGTVWSDDDFTRFGALGLGSGGFGALYPIGFNYIFRLMPNGLETNQAIFPAGIQSICTSLGQKLQQAGGTVLLNTAAEVISLSPRMNNVVVAATNAQGTTQHTFHRVIVATSHRAMEMDQFLNGPNYPEAPQIPAVSADVGEAITRIHCVPSSKLFVRTRKFWSDTKYPRNILTDTKVPQVYTLDYGATHAGQDTGMVLVTYTWGDDSIKTLAFGDKNALLAELKRQLALVVEGTPFADYADKIVPVDGEDDIQLINWESEPNFYGAFTLAQPGQDTYLQTAYFDFMKAQRIDGHRSVSDSGVYLATDNISFTGGWVDGALQSGLNAASAVIESVQGTFKNNNLAPIKVLQPGRYTY